MQILVNGEPHDISTELRLTELLAQLQLAGKRVAVEVNEELVPRSAHPDCVLQPGDRVEIVQAIGGG